MLLITDRETARYQVASSLFLFLNMGMILAIFSESGYFPVLSASLMNRASIGDTSEETSLSSLNGISSKSRFFLSFSLLIIETIPSAAHPLN